MNISEALEVTNEDGSLENKKEDDNAACRKRKRSGSKSKSRNSALIASAEQADTSSDDSDSSSKPDSEEAAPEAKVLVTSQRARCDGFMVAAENNTESERSRRLDCFEATIDNHINNLIEIGRTEDVMAMIRYTMSVYDHIQARYVAHGGGLPGEPPL